MSDWSGSIPELLFTYVQDSKPSGASEGETWYDDGENQAYVFTDDVGSTTEFTVTSHDALGGIGADDHHAQAHDNADHTTDYLPSTDYTPEQDTHSAPTGTATQSATIYTAKWSRYFDSTTDYTEVINAPMEGISESTTPSVGSYTITVFDTAGNQIGQISDSSGADSWTQQVVSHIRFDINDTGNLSLDFEIGTFESHSHGI